MIIPYHKYLDEAGGGANNNDDNKNDNKDTSQSWEDFLKTLAPEAQELYNGHVAGLKSTVSNTRKERDDLASKLKKATETVEKGSEAQKQLDAISAELEEQKLRADFAEMAVKPEIGCSNPKLAWLVAKQEGYFDKKGNPDWEAIRKTAPELFIKMPKTITGGGNSGDNSNPSNSINAAIRKAAGR